MIAPDTNVLVRIITNDDANQAAIAADSLRSDKIFLCKTVIMELEWVLRYSYGFDRATIEKALATLLGLRASVVEDAATIVQAIAWYAQGMDLADALHVASSKGVDTFVTFDRKLAKTAADQKSHPSVKCLAATEND